MSIDTVSIIFRGQRPEISRTGLFILALLVGGGSISLYDLKAHALLSPGKVQPALKFLRDKGMIKEQPNKIERIDYVITAAGEKALSQNWFSMTSSSARDLSQGLMAAWLPLALDKREEAAQSLFKWADVLRLKADRLERWESGRSGRLLQAFGQTYRRAKADSLRAEAAVLENIATEMKSWD